MRDMQKVRVSLTDADGKVHEVVGYESITKLGFIEVLPQRSDGNALTREVDWHIVCGPRFVTPIQELPTGLGAVVEVQYGPPINDSEWFIRVDDSWWYPTGLLDPVKDEFFDTVSYTVLSEGANRD